MIKKLIDQAPLGFAQNDLIPEIIIKHLYCTESADYGHMIHEVILFFDEIYVLKPIL